METPTLPLPAQSHTTDIVGLRTSGVFPKDKRAIHRTLREWTKLRRTPYRRLGHFVYCDPSEVATHIRTKLRVSARGE